VFHRLVNKKGSVAGTLDFKLSVEVPDSADALSPQTPLSPPLPSSSSHASDDGLPSTPPKRPPMFAMTSSKSKGSRTSLSSVASGASGFDTFSDAAPWDESPRTKNTGLLPSTSSSGSLGVSGSGSGSGTVNRKAGSIRSSPYFRGQDIVEEPTEYDLKGQETGSIFSDSTLTDSMSSPGAGPSSFPSPSSPALSRNSPLSERVRSLTTSMELRNESTSSLGDAVDSLGLLMGFFDRVAQSNLFLLVAWSALGTALRVRVSFSYRHSLEPEIDLFLYLLTRRFTGGQVPTRTRQHNPHDMQTNPGHASVRSKCQRLTTIGGRDGCSGRDDSSY
jgi:hypothetical protein